MEKALDIIKYRSAKETDIPFIYSTWIKALYNGNRSLRLTDYGKFAARYSKIIDSLLNESSVTIACIEGYEDEIKGYAVRSGQTLHFVYVKRQWRKQGIASFMTLGIKQVSHLTNLGERIIIKKDIKYNPFYKEN